MSGFYPVLGLLAVAVCISYAEGAPFSPVQKDDITARKLPNPNLQISSLTEEDDAPLKRKLYNKHDGIANRNDTLDTTGIHERNYESLKQATAFKKLNGLESKENDASALLVKATKSSGGSDGEDVVEAVGVLSNDGKLHPAEKRFSEYKNRYEVNSYSAIGRGLTSSESEEDCDEDETNEGNPTASISATTPSDANSPTETDEECETEEPTESNSSEPSGSPSQSHETTQSVDNVRTTPTETTQRTKKPRNPDQSSGSFHDEDSVGVDFSDSISRESYGQSTEIRE